MYAWTCRGINEQNDQIAWAANTHTRTHISLTLGSLSGQATRPQLTLTNAVGVSMGARCVFSLGCGYRRVLALQRNTNYSIKLPYFKLLNISWCCFYSDPSLNKSELLENVKKIVHQTSPKTTKFLKSSLLLDSHTYFCKQDYFFCTLCQPRCCRLVYPTAQENYICLLKPEELGPLTHTETFCSYQLLSENLPRNSPQHHHR